MDPIAFLESRRSASPKALGLPVPSGAELERILTIASRTPDHGRLAPWRFVVLAGPGLASLAGAVGEAFRADHPEADDAAVRAARQRYDDAPMIVAVVSRARPQHPDRPGIPEWEQILTCGAVCMNLLHACHAHGYGAVWLSGWPAYHPAVLSHLGLAAHERLAGFVHVGTEPGKQEDRPRPRLDELVTMRDR
ncbi:MAG: nitroreductase [Phycisphaerales bacterium]|nr:nitroreductase [Planctomycetota bacterium]MCH8508826.1 nitroreductase [Phycisphaerales bacterium]